MPSREKQACSLRAVSNKGELRKSPFSRRTSSASMTSAGIVDKPGWIVNYRLEFDPVGPFR
jgi:hypothetical protein